MPILRAFRRFLDLDSHDSRAVALYGAVVEQARKPTFYTEMKVADTVDGRFDMIVLHLFLILNRFPKAERQNPVLRAMLEEHFADMDNSLREIGVGDLSVPKKIHRMIDALYGRFENYEKALGGSTPVEDMCGALARNVYREETMEDPANATGLERLTRYVLEAQARLARQEPAAILAGTVEFPPPMAAEAAPDKGNEND